MIHDLGVFRFLLNIGPYEVLARHWADFEGKKQVLERPLEG